MSKCRREIETEGFTLERVRYTENWYYFPEYVLISAGSYYRTDRDYESGYSYTKCGTYEDMQWAGDSVTIVDANKKLVEYHYME